MNKFIATILIFLAAITQGGAQPGEFGLNGLTFSFPVDWSVTEQEQFENGNCYLSCEKSGETASGLVTMIWTNSNDFLEESIDKFVRKIKEKYEGVGAKPAMTKPVEADYGAFKGIKTTFTVSVMGLPHKGSIHSFHACGKTVTVLLQEAIVDAQDNKEGFERIQETLRCE